MPTLFLTLQTHHRNVEKSRGKQHVDKEITIFQSQRHLFLLAQLLTIDLTCSFGPSGQIGPAEVATNKGSCLWPSPWPRPRRQRIQIGSCRIINHSIKHLRLEAHKVDSNRSESIPFDSIRFDSLHSKYVRMINK